MNPEKLMIMNNSSKSNFEWQRFLKAVWLKKHWIVLFSLVFSILGGYLYNKYFKISKEYTVTSVIRFEDPRGRNESSGVADFAQLGSEGKVAILTTRSLLNKVVDSLKLNIVIQDPEINRLKFIKSVKIYPAAKFGTYTLEIKDKKLLIKYKSENTNNEEINLKSQKLPDTQLTDISMNRINLVVDSRILQNNEKIKISYIKNTFAIKKIRDNLEPKLDRSKTILTIDYTDHDPQLAALTLNTISHLFLDQLLSYRRFQTVEVLQSLSDQLKTAQEQLKISEDKVRRYREQNPYVSLSNEGGTVLTDIVTTEKDLNLLKQNLEDLNSALNRPKNAGDFQLLNLYYLESVHVLSQQNVVGAILIEEQLNNLISERETLLADYSPKHPLVEENRQKIVDLQSKIEQRAEEYLVRLKKQINKQENLIGASKRNLQRLPSKELKLAELERNRQIKADIVSAIMSKYNEARVADASIVADAYLIDEAQAPIITDSPLEEILPYILGFLLGLLIGIAVFFVIEYFDPTVKNVKNTEELLKLPVLASIPVIGSEKPIPDSDELKKRIDPKLITVDYSPTIEGEAFRMIRTKLVFDEAKKNNSLVITSLNPDEGKSLVSSNLSITFAQQKYPTLLVDCDLRRGVLHNSFGCSKKPGLSDILKSSSMLSLNSISEIIQETHIPNLFLITSGTAIPNPSELLGGLKMKQFVELVEKKFGIVIMDTAPISFTPDAFVVNSFIHKILLVVRYGKTNLNKLSDKTKEFESIKKDFVGVVINASKEISKKDHYSYSYYHY